LDANALVALNLVGALLLGMVVGYERSYNGRAAGLRTYGLVSMASCALTVMVGYSDYWYGGMGTPRFPDRYIKHPQTCSCSKERMVCARAGTVPSLGLLARKPEAILPFAPAVLAFRVAR